MWTRFALSFSATVGLHRSMLIGATIGVAIAASRVATLPDETASWVLLAGSALLVIVADLAREVEDAASALAESSGVSRRDARRDIYSARRPRFFGSCLIVALALIAASLVLYAADERDDAKNKPPGGTASPGQVTGRGQARLGERRAPEREQAARGPS